MKYRKKPVIIEAVQLRWDTWSEMREFAGVGKLTDGKPEGFNPGGDSNVIGLRIPTLEGLMEAVQCDWIIRGVKGELYSCKPDIFAATYEPVERPKVSSSTNETILTHYENADPCHWKCSCGKTYDHPDWRKRGKVMQHLHWDGEHADWRDAEYVPI